MVWRLVFPLLQGTLFSVGVSHGNISKFTISLSDKSSAVQGRVLLHRTRMLPIHGIDSMRPLPGYKEPCLGISQLLYSVMGISVVLDIVFESIWFLIILGTQTPITIPHDVQ